MIYLSVKGGLRFAKSPELVVSVVNLLLQIGLLHGQLLLVHVGVPEGLVEVLQPGGGIGDVAGEALVGLLYGCLDMITE